MKTFLWAIVVCPTIVLFTSLLLTVPSATTHAQPSGCGILFYDLEPGPPPQPPVDSEVQRMRDLGYDVTEADDASVLELANLLSYNVVMIVNGPPGVIGDYQGDISEYVSAGGALVIHSPGRGGLIDYAPAGFEVSIVGDSWCDAPQPHYWSTIIEDTHPLTAGLSESDLPGSWRMVGIFQATYTELTSNSYCGDPALAVGSHGQGTVVFDTSYFAIGNLVPGTDAFLTNYLDYLCSVGTPTPNAVTGWGAMKARYGDSADPGAATRRGGGK